MNVVFFGTPEFAVPALERLIASPYRVVGVVTQPGRPRGRGQKIAEGEVADCARAHGLPVLQPDRLKDNGFLAALDGFGADLGVVAAYGRILPDAVLQTPRLGFINLHASLLPRYRGAAPVQRAILAGEVQTGVSIMRVVAELDAGPVFLAEAVPIASHETSVELERRLAAVGAAALLRVADALARGEAVATPQDDRLASYAPRITKEEGIIRWARPAETIHNQVRALHPWPHAWTTLAGRRYIIIESAVAPDPPAPSPPPGERRPGQILVASGSSVIVAAGLSASLRILRIQPEGKRAMETREFLAGHPLAPGMVLGEG